MQVLKSIRCLFLLAICLSGCKSPAPSIPDPGSSGTAKSSARIFVIADFEKPDPAFTWTATAPSEQTALFSRIAQRPEAGLWSLSIPLTESGQLRCTIDDPIDLSRFDILSIQAAHLDSPSHNGECSAGIILTDADGRSARGDAYPVKSKWGAVLLDLNRAAEAGIDLTRITAVALALKPVQPLSADAPLLIQTDSWTARSNASIYLGNEKGLPQSFYVNSEGMSLHVGSVGRYDLWLHDRGTPATGDAAEWIELYSGNRERRLLGQPGIGILLLDQTAFDQLGPYRQLGNQPAPPPPSPQPLLSWPSPASLSTLTWSIVWTSPIAAILEGRQEVGPFDRLGEPALLLKWRFMVYRAGQAFVSVAWSKPGEFTTPNPVTWALAIDPSVRNASQPADAAAIERLATIYTQPFRNGLTATSVLPDRMQVDWPVTLIARATARKDNFWRAADNRRHYFGAGITGIAPNASQGEACCMLLMDQPTALMNAGNFSQYLDPVKIVMRQGEKELTYPGDADNDGFVESYGFHAIRLANGRATFTIYPQERPIFYPAFLFTVPAVEKDKLDVKNSRLLINIDGKQFADPPAFPSGSYLLQLPYQLDRPVNVEALLIHK